MATGVAMVVVAAYNNMQQRSAARRTRKAAETLAEKNAVMAEEDSAENIRQMRKQQGQTIGMAKAQAAASGIKFDATKINEVDFDEGGFKREYYDVSADQSQTFDAGTDRWNENDQDYDRTELTTGRKFKLSNDEFGTQTAGATEGSSTFNYLRSMKQAFANDLGWQAKLGKSRADVARFGGVIAGVEYKASRARANAEMYSSFAKAYGKS